MKKEIEIKDKRWELLTEVKRGLQELPMESPEIPKLIETTEKLQELKEKISMQQEDLKLEYLISCRERNVYLEKLRKAEEFCEDKNWTDEDGIMKDIYDILYNDN